MSDWGDEAAERAYQRGLADAERALATAGPPHIVKPTVELVPLLGEPKVREPKAKPSKPQGNARAAAMELPKAKKPKTAKPKKQSARPKKPKALPSSAKIAERKRFVELRASGIPLAACQRELGVGVTTIKRWNKDARLLAAIALVREAKGGGA